MPALCEDCKYNYNCPRDEGTTIRGPQSPIRECESYICNPEPIGRCKICKWWGEMSDMGVRVTTCGKTKKDFPEVFLITAECRKTSVFHRRSEKDWCGEFETL